MHPFLVVHEVLWSFSLIVALITGKSHFVVLILLKRSNY